MTTKRIILGITSCFVFLGLHACEGERAAEPVNQGTNQEAQQTQPPEQTQTLENTGEQTESEFE